MSRSYDEARVRAMSQPNYDPIWASGSQHKRDMWPAPDRRRKCRCGCGGRVTHIGGTNAIALVSGCEMKVRRWVKEGDREATKGPEACEVRRWRTLGLEAGTDTTDVISGRESGAGRIWEGK